MQATLEGLDSIGQVAVSRVRNGNGHDWRVTFLSELGDVPTLAVNDVGLAGPFARVAVVTVVSGQPAGNYGSMFVTGPGASSTVLPGLSVGTPYQVRVSAHNLRGYSYPLVGYPALLAPKAAPSAPFNASFFALSPARLKLVWQTPRELNGAAIESYRVEYDIAADFANVPQNGNTRQLVVAPLPLNETSTYCLDIDINPASSTVPRYARVFAYNGFAWSLAGFPTPRSSIGEIKSPGPPTNVLAAPTSATGIIVRWSLPAADQCAYGGDGGSLITYYIVEWDSRPDFASPAAQATTFDLTNFAYQIGGRNVTTGVVSTTLEPATTYWVRVTAFNSKGAGRAGYAPYPVTTTDVPPDAPRSLTVRTVDPTTLQVAWSPPERDGGATLEKYRMQYSSDLTFAAYEYLDLPVVPEVQAVIAESDVQVEVQAIRALVQVTNERQVIRSQVTGVDEVQTVTTHCDDVTDEVQRVVTTAFDIDEVQSLEIVGSDVNEVQAIRTHTLDIPTVQVGGTIQYF